MDQNVLIFTLVIILVSVDTNHSYPISNTNFKSENENTNNNNRSTIEIKDDKSDADCRNNTRFLPPMDKVEKLKNYTYQKRGLQPIIKKSKSRKWIVDCSDKIYEIIKNSPEGSKSIFQCSEKKNLLPSRNNFKSYHSIPKHLPKFSRVNKLEIDTGQNCTNSTTTTIAPTFSTFTPEIQLSSTTMSTIPETKIVIRCIGKRLPPTNNSMKSYRLHPKRLPKFSKGNFSYQNCTIETVTTDSPFVSKIETTTLISTVEKPDIPSTEKPEVKHRLWRKKKKCQKLKSIKSGVKYRKPMIKFPGRRRTRLPRVKIMTNMTLTTASPIGRRTLPPIYSTVNDEDEEGCMEEEDEIFDLSSSSTASSSRMGIFTQSLHISTTIEPSEDEKSTTIQLPEDTINFMNMSKVSDPTINESRNDSKLNLTDIIHTTTEISNASENIETTTVIPQNENDYSEMTSTESSTKKYGGGMSLRKETPIYTFTTTETSSTTNLDNEFLYYYTELSNDSTPTKPSGGPIIGRGIIHVGNDSNTTTPNTTSQSFTTEFDLYTTTENTTETNPYVTTESYTNSINSISNSTSSIMKDDDPLSGKITTTENDSAENYTAGINFYTTTEITTEMIQNTTNSSTTEPLLGGIKGRGIRPGIDNNETDYLSTSTTKEIYFPQNSTFQNYYYTTEINPYTTTFSSLIEIVSSTTDSSLDDPLSGKIKGRGLKPGIGPSGTDSSSTSNTDTTTDKYSTTSQSFTSEINNTTMGNPTETNPYVTTDSDTEGINFYTTTEITTEMSLNTTNSSVKDPSPGGRGIRPEIGNNETDYLSTSTTKEIYTTQNTTFQNYTTEINPYTTTFNSLIEIISNTTNSSKDPLSGGIVGRGLRPGIGPSGTASNSTSNADTTTENYSTQETTSQTYVTEIMYPNTKNSSIFDLKPRLVTGEEIVSTSTEWSKSTLPEDGIGPKSSIAPNINDSLDSTIPTISSLLLPDTTTEQSKDKFVYAQIKRRNRYKNRRKETDLLFGPQRYRDSYRVYLF